MDVGLRVNRHSRLVWHRRINGKHFSFEMISIQAGRMTHVSIRVSELSRRGPLIRHNICFDTEEGS